MSHAPPTSSRVREEHLLIKHALDFSGAYMSIKFIGQHTADYPFTVTCQTLDALFCVFDDIQRFDKAKQAFFLYHEAACTLVEIGRTVDNKISRTIVPKLVSLLMKGSGKRLRALGLALGRLADNSPATDIPSFSEKILALDIDLACLLEKFTAADRTSASLIQWAWKGRSLIARSGTKILGVVKFATTLENINEIYREAVWMEWFAENKGSLTHVPTPVRIQGRYLYNITDELPKGSPDTIYGNICIVFIPCPGYYQYPDLKNAAWEHIESSFFKSAFTLGCLSSVGIFHTALIPLFHNRVQQGRRNDDGKYLWEHAGRLDQWLDSSRFPNFAASGLRDFEHIAVRKKQLDLEHYTGEYILSFILVAGACFRNKAPHRRGTDNTHPPVDTRDLFCPDQFRSILTGVCEHYFKGLTGSEVFDPAPFNIPKLIEQLIEKMGIDEHMQETLRVRDQLDMNDNQYKNFLANRGVMAIPAKGEKEIVLFTGPHLGGFNQPISIPELIEFLFKFSAFCVSSCYFYNSHGLT